MKRLMILLLLITCACAYADDAQMQNDSTQTPQQPPIYQVDIIVFKNIKGLQDLPDSQWLPYQRPNFQDAQALSQQSMIAPIEQQQIELYTPLPDNQFILNQDSAHIRRSSLYNFITQQSWLQQALDPAQTQTVLITGGQNYAENDVNPIWELVGTVKLTNSLYQYLNLQVNFYLTMPGTKASQNVSSKDFTSDYLGLQMLHMQESRRIKVNQLNYIDSPGFGLLIKVIPVKPKNQS